MSAKTAGGFLFLKRNNLGEMLKFHHIFVAVHVWILQLELVIDPEGKSSATITSFTVRFPEKLCRVLTE